MTLQPTVNQPSTSVTLPLPFAAWVKAYPLIAYFLLAFAGAWIALLPLLLAQNGVGLLPFKITTQPIATNDLFSALGALAGPTLAAFWVTYVTAGKAGVSQLLRRYGQWRLGLHWYLLVLFAFPLISSFSHSICQRF